MTDLQCVHKWQKLHMKLWENKWKHTKQLTTPHSYTQIRNSPTHLFPFKNASPEIFFLTIFWTPYNFLFQEVFNLFEYTMVIYDGIEQIF